jgi:hypothetical protein
MANANPTSPLYKKYAYAGGGGFPGGNTSLLKLMRCNVKCELISRSTY